MHNNKPSAWFTLWNKLNLICIHSFQSIFKFVLYGMFYRDGKNKLIIADKLITDKMSIYLSSSRNQDIKRNTLRNCETLLQNAAQKDKSPLLTFYFVNDIFKIVYATVMDFCVLQPLIVQGNALMI